MADQPVARPLPTHKDYTNTEEMPIQPSIPLSEIRTHDPSVRASEGSSCHRPRGHSSAFSEGKIVPVLNYYAQRHDDIWWSGGIAPSLLISALEAGEWSASRPRPLPPGKQAPVSIRFEAGWASEPVLTPLTEIELRPFCP
jgi:hypothetical protein